eukprot:TRINITY_DN6015_c0_g1_i1.p1 TRINITY_DN6015_c0_g1~~TRINITY_DN6015_c0_g1_i1.p1  ORF type:complete len:145 (+),score=22.76 TRINITY_DN6015_c0_g1_i1:186-620(+)
MKPAILENVFSNYATVQTNLRVNRSITAGSVCLRGICRRSWNDDVLKERSKFGIMEREITVKRGAEEIFYIGEFEARKEFSVQVSAIMGTGLFQTDVLKGGSNGVGTKIFRNTEIKKGSFWVSVKRKDNFSNDCKIKVTVLEIF